MVTSGSANVSFSRLEPLGSSRTDFPRPAPILAVPDASPNSGAVCGRERC